ncbi:hypothetical protein [Methermicoccus shengliensis]|uniref:Uncharacterized protein n=1 Tax=Methermicoccus shengliensis TaxID=660064 RepID=A0A832RSH4_9EURY|nr:hypothetical protein [Methermicoccus shengliensis]KUK05132.1 MAG: hypothetical protein XD46_0125 [Euryarchaeota archaeon 55_53]KUK30698.1 MAG: hypothetical protein XD62_0207 [Methanosarcinales archeaon 56_1174]MDI3487292.1 hypothetical protein [Methanosarcinales archaeon]MDN5294633.1 hypothetical protein [Methanosarcinales archaeon]HIH69340.1 hypothetical protein [Methermicoccus shengliensis]
MEVEKILKEVDIDFESFRQQIKRWGDFSNLELALGEGISREELIEDLLHPLSDSDRFEVFGKGFGRR